MKIPENQAFIDALTRKYLTAEPEPEPHGNSHTRGHANGRPLDLSDEEIITLCRQAANAAKFASLYDDGDTSAYEHDDSRADQALASLLAFYTDDAAQLERLIGSSARGRREKWIRRGDYRGRTIEKALSDPSRERYKRSHSKVSSSSSLHSDDDDDDHGRRPCGRGRR